MQHVEVPSRNILIIHLYTYLYQILPCMYSAVQLRGRQNDCTSHAEHVRLNICPAKMLRRKMSPVIRRSETLCNVLTKSTKRGRSKYKLHYYFILSRQILRLHVYGLQYSCLEWL
jgi:hypothetical protein